MYVLSLVIGLAAVLLLLVAVVALVRPARRAAATAKAVRPAANPRLAVLRLSLDELKAAIRQRQAGASERTGSDGHGAA